MADYSGYQHLAITIDDGIAVVRMNRPEKLNAFNRVMGLELLRIPTQLKDDPDVRVVILTGTGRGYCTGVDFTEPRTEGAENPFARQKMDELGYSGRLPLAWHEIDKPSIAAVNGVAAGGGMSLAFVQDIRIVARSARFVPMFPKRGLAPEVGSSWVVPRLLGTERALEWFYTGDEINGEQAHAYGLASHLVEDDALMDAAMALAKKITRGAPIAQRLSRRSIYHAMDFPLREHLPFESANVGITQTTEDYVEGRQAVLEKRQPKFTGR